MYDINPSIKYPVSQSHTKSSKTLRLYNAISEDRIYNNQTTFNRSSDMIQRAKRERFQIASQKHNSSGRWSEQEKLEKNVSVGRIRLPPSLQVQLRNPQSQHSINVFNSKTQKILEMGERFKSQLEDRKMLQQQIKLLKKSIKEQTKYRDKLSIRTRHLMNEEQSIKVKVRQIQLEYFRRQAVERELRQQCHSISKQVEYIRGQNQKVLMRIQQQQIRINGYEELIGRLKKVISNASNEVGELKSVRLMAHKSMMNDLSLMNKRQEQKQMLFQLVDDGINRNTKL